MGGCEYRDYEVIQDLVERIRCWKELVCRFKLGL